MPAPTKRIITGVSSIDRKLKKFKASPANRIARAGLRKGASLAAKQIKKEVPAKLKTVRASIGSSVKTKKGNVTAKVGAAVGKRRSKPKRTTKTGVGISDRNIHWWVLGTDRRRKKSTGQNVGKMSANGVVKKGFAGHAVRLAIIEGAKKQMKKETEKLKRSK